VTEGDGMLAAFRATLARCPGAPAVHYFETTLTFAELDAKSDALAAALAAGGLRRGQRVAVYLQNVPQFFVVALGTWKAGGTLVVVSPMLRHKELDHLLADCGATVLVALESLWADVAREVVADTEVSRVITTSELDGLREPLQSVMASCVRNRDPRIEDLTELLATYAGERRPDPRLDPDDVAILTYTSGTTGPAKGAMNTHGNLLTAALSYRDQVELTDDDVILGIAPLFHITGLTAHLALGLVAGIPTVLTYRFDLDAVFDAIERRQTTFTVAAVTAYVALMNAGRRDVSSLRRTLSGGAPIASALAGAWEQHSGVPLVPVYGLTETTGPTHMVPVGATPPVSPEFGALSVGRAIPGTTVRVIADDGSEVPTGQPGELVIGGPQVVPGYWENPVETARAFTNGEVRTGDVAVVDGDGWCYIVDRKKDLINASGYKVWPREVEDELLTHSEVREAAVIGVPDGYRGESVKAFVSLRANATVTSEALIAYCRERMAAYKYPRSVVVLDELPKNPSGKILRRALREGVSSDGSA
jgi:long-chain acyl-CoA synthetase